MSNKELTNTLADQIKLDEDGEPTVKYYIETYEIGNPDEYTKVSENNYYTIDDLKKYKDEDELIKIFEKYYTNPKDDWYYFLTKYELCEDGFENFEVLATANYRRHERELYSKYGTYYSGMIDDIDEDDIDE